jgi:outer membrane protein assembly factor BamD (BamD/ComL family)
MLSRTFSTAVQALCAAAVLQILPLAAAQDPMPRERERLDPDTAEWVIAEPELEGSPDADLRRVQRHLVDGQPAKARALLKRWFKANPDNPRQWDAHFLAGEALFDLKDYWKAYEEYEIVVANASGDLYRRALLREMDVARAFLSGQPRIVLKTIRLPAQDDGIEILDRVWERAPGTRLGEEALLLKANHFFDTGRAELAQDEYALLAKEYPNGRYKQFAMLRAAESAERAFPGIRFDDRPLLDADERYRQLQDAYPGYAERERVDARRTAIRDQRAAKDLSIGDWYRKTGNVAAAEFYYRSILKDWPDTFAAGEARSRLLGLGVRVEEASS